MKWVLLIWKSSLIGIGILCFCLIEVVYAQSADRARQSLFQGIMEQQFRNSYRMTIWGQIPEGIPAISDAADEVIYGGIFRLAFAESQGDLDSYISCQKCDIRQRKADLQGLKDFFAMPPEIALIKTLHLVNRCIIEARGYRMGQELLQPICEGSLFSLGYFIQSAEKREVYNLFSLYLALDLTIEQKMSLAGIWYPRYNGVIWYSGEVSTTSWLILTESLNKKHKLYTNEQLEVVRQKFLSPPNKLIYEEFLFPPLHIHQRLQSLN